MRILILIGLLTISVDNFACSCDRVGILKNKKEVDIVFKGRVTEVIETTTQEFETREKNQIEYTVTKYTFDILKNHKGLDNKKTIDLLMDQMTDCPVTFLKNKSYIVYAHTDNKKLHYKLQDQEIEPYITTHLCTRTKKTNVLTFWETFVLWLS